MNVSRAGDGQEPARVVEEVDGRAARPAALVDELLDPAPADP